VHYKKEIDHDFDDAKREFDKETKESMDRGVLPAHEVFKMLPYTQIVFGLVGLSGLKKLVDIVVA